MHRPDASLGVVQGRKWCSLAIVAFLGLSNILGCVFADCGDMLTLRGQLLDEETLTPVTDVYLGGRSFTSDEETCAITPFTRWGDPRVPPPQEDGVFEVQFSIGLVPCDPPPQFPRPDQVEVIVVRGECEFSFLIEINEDTVVDMDFPDDVIELKDPILVPACEPEEGP